MTLSVLPRRFILVLILLTPLVNNANGFLMWRFGVSAVGPLFYAGLLGVVSLALLSLRYDRATALNNYLLLFALVGWFILHGRLYGGWVSSFSSYTKFFLPFLLYRFLRLNFTGDRRVILDALAAAMILWASFAILCAVLRIKPSAGEGWYGFIHGNNDYVAMVFALFPTLTLWRGRIGTVAYYIAVFLTRSKGLLLLGLMIVLQHRSKAVRLFFLFVLAATVSYYTAYFYQHYGKGLKITPYQFIQFMSFGRLKYFFILLGNYDLKSGVEHLFGSGFAGSFVLIEGKVGVEMDLIDVHNIFGIVGLAAAAFFYYGKVFGNRALPLRAKMNFLPLFAYSALGGHLMFNPASNVVFVLIVFVFEDPAIAARLDPSRPRKGDQAEATEGEALPAEPTAGRTREA